MNLMTAAVAVVFLVAGIMGFRRGLVRTVSGLLAVVLSAMLVSFLLPYVTQFIRTNTPVYRVVEEQCQKSIDQFARKVLSGNYLSSEGIQILDGGEYPDLDARSILGNLTKNEQTQMIQELPIPEFLQDLILTFNNRDGYLKLGVNSFFDYIVALVASLIVDIAAFFATMLIVGLIIWLILSLLKVFTRFPVVSMADRFGGLLLGLVKGLIAVWMIMLVIYLFSGTEIGMRLLTMINNSKLLKPLYDNNIFLKIIANTITGTL